MKSLTFYSSLITFMFVLSSFALSTDIKYTSIDGKFSIIFPAAYESTSKKSEDYTTIKTQAVLEDQLFYVSNSLHKLQVKERESMAATSLETFNKSLGGTITNQATWSIKENNGLQAEIEIPEKNLKVAYRAILIGQIQYQIVVISESANWNQENADKFIKSFKIEK